MKLISLSSIPSRFDKIGPTLECLAAQRADAVELWIPGRYRRFPEYDGSLPSVPAGITIRRSATDLGPASKVLFALKAHADAPGTQVLFCDDDRAYPRGWADALFAAQAARPREAVALAGWNLEDRGLPVPSARPEPRALRRPRRWDMDYRLRRAGQILRGRGRVALRDKPPRRLIARAGYVDVLEGYGGAVVRPGFLGPEAWDIPAAAWTVDDVWLSGMLAARGIGIWMPANLYEPKTTEADLTDALFRWEVEGLDRLRQDRRCVEHLRMAFGIWH